MSFQAYLDTIKAKTGKSPKDFLSLAKAKGLLAPGVKAGQIVAWLKEDFQLGHGHAMALVAAFKSATLPKVGAEEKIDSHFSGQKAKWRKPWDSLLRKLHTFGKDVTIAPTDSYLSLLRNGKKFGVVQIAVEGMSVGIKLKGKPANGRLEASGKWNAMVTHRVRIADPKEIDAELHKWLRQGYDKA